MDVLNHLLAILLLQPTLNKCSAKILINLINSEDTYGLIESTVRVIKSSHEYSLNGVGVVGESAAVVLPLLMSKEYIPVILIDNSEGSIESTPLILSKRNKLQLFVVVVSSSAKLHGHLATVRNTRWWNHMADFWLVEWPPSANSCTRAFEYLWSAWTMNILNAKFVCVDETKGTLIYDFNPYARSVPHPWRLESVHNGENDHPWSLLWRKLSISSDVYPNLSFDKTNDLSGYEIRLSLGIKIDATSSHNSIDLADTMLTRYPIFETLLRSMNATPKLVFHDIKEPLGVIDEEGKVNGTLALTYYGTRDITIFSMHHRTISSISCTYPHVWKGISILTQYRGSATQLQKIASLFDKGSLAGLFVVCLVTFTFFKVVLRQKFSIASLNVLRIICNSCLVELPHILSSRIYLSSLFFVVVTIQGIYQGSLSSLLAKDEPLHNVDSIQDLEQSGHLIYGHSQYAVYFRGPKFRGRFVELDSHNCTKYVLRNSANACVRSTRYILADAARFNLHMSKNSIAGFAASFLVRRDWPLEQKFNQKIQALVEADIFFRRQQESMKKNMRIVMANENSYAERSVKILNLNDLKFTFNILAIGLTVSALTFSIEVFKRWAHQR